MSEQTWNESLVAMQADGAALASSTTATSLLHATGLYVLPTNFFGFIGKRIKVVAAGRISTVVTTPGTLTLDFKLGSTIAATSGAMALNIVAKTNVPWRLEWEMTCRAVGISTTTTLMHQGIWQSEAVIGAAAPAAGGCGTHLLPNAAPAVGTGFAWNATQAVDLFATWSVNSASNSITCHQFELISLN
jgi:hypothetical protein